MTFMWYKVSKRSMVERPSNANVSNSGISAILLPRKNASSSSLKMTKTHLANGPRKKSLNFIFPTKYVIPKSLKFSHWPSKKIVFWDF